VPLIKLTISDGRKVDITFWHEGHSGLASIEFVNKALEFEPGLKPLLLVLKKVLYLEDMNDVYTGGLSSYGLFLMALFVEQAGYHRGRPAEGLAARVVGFLEFFGEGFDYMNKALLVNAGPEGLQPLSPASPLYA
jgi:non-canonical poly(A) RNA polymerase PAPD5/7